MSRFVSLMYHNVCALRSCDGSWPGFVNLSPSVTGYFVDRETFAGHCSILSAQGSNSGTESVQITFDDGWRGTFDEAGPILEAHNLSAVLFVTTDLIGHPDFADRHQLAAASPTFSLGAHGRTHRLLATLPDDAVREELTTSKAVLEDILGCEVDQLSFSRRIVR